MTSWCPRLQVSPKIAVHLSSPRLQSCQSWAPRLTLGFSTGLLPDMAAGSPEQTKEQWETPPRWRPPALHALLLGWHLIIFAIFYSVLSLCHIPLKNMTLKPLHPSKAYDKLWPHNTFCQKEKLKTKPLQQKAWAIKTTASISILVPLRIWLESHSEMFQAPLHHTILPEARETGAKQ